MLLQLLARTGWRKFLVWPISRHHLSSFIFLGCLYAYNQYIVGSTIAKPFFSFKYCHIALNCAHRFRLIACSKCHLSEHRLWDHSHRRIICLMMSIPSLNAFLFAAIIVVAAFSNFAEVYTWIQIGLYRLPPTAVHAPSFRHMAIHLIVAAKKKLVGSLLRILIFANLSQRPKLFRQAENPGNNFYCT